MTRNILSSRETYKPFDYPWAYEAWEEHEMSFWIHRKVNLNTDIEHYNKDSKDSRKFIESILLYFTQADVDVGCAYLSRYSQVFQLPEVRQMVSSIASRESIHISAYSYLNNSLGFPDSSFEEFLKIPAMRNKHNFIENKLESSNGDIPDIDNYISIIDFIVEIATYTLLSEGCSLFGLFSMLFSYSDSDVNKYPGMTDIVQWSVSDEDMHVKFMSKVLETLIDETPFDNETIYAQLEQELLPLVEEFVSLEKDFISYLMDGLDLHIDKWQVYQYMDTVLKKRFSMFSSDFVESLPRFMDDVTFCDWFYSESKDNKGDIDKVVNQMRSITAITATNFFERTTVEYSDSSVDYSSYDKINWVN